MSNKGKEMDYNLAGRVPVRPRLSPSSPVTAPTTGARQSPRYDTSLGRASAPQQQPHPTSHQQQPNPTQQHPSHAKVNAKTPSPLTQPAAVRKVAPAISPVTAPSLPTESAIAWAPAPAASAPTIASGSSATASTPSGTKSRTTKSDYKKESKVYSEEEILGILSNGYINIQKTLWDHIPAGAHVCYFKKAGETRSEKFKPGGFVRYHYTTDDGVKIIQLENHKKHPGEKKGYYTWPIRYEDVEEIWKQYDVGAFIEIHLIYNSLAQKKRQIEDLTARLERLEAMVKNK